MSERIQIGNSATPEEKPLEDEIKSFIQNQKYWGRLLCEKIISGNEITNADFNKVYSYLLEELHLKDKSEHPDLPTFTFNDNNQSYKKDLLLTKVTKVKGVNALAEDQTIEFSPKLTIIYGINGSGKSGYSRLMKKTFFSRSVETILPNIYDQTSNQEPAGIWGLKSEGKDILLEYPSDKNNYLFRQFAVFDNKVTQHIGNSNGFEFRPSGLNFFSEYTSAVSKISERLSQEIKKRNSENIFADYFQGESEIKNIIKSITHRTDINHIKQQAEYNENDILEKENVSKEYNLSVAENYNKEKEIARLERLKKLLSIAKNSIVQNNNLFSADSLLNINQSIKDSNSKEKRARQEGIENFSTTDVIGSGSPEWQKFIDAAFEFASLQTQDKTEYPQNGDNCLFCHQPLTNEAQELINNYWAYINSIAEELAQKSKALLNKYQSSYENLKFEFFPLGSELIIWLKENYTEILIKVQESIDHQNELRIKIIGALKEKQETDGIPVQIDSSPIEEIIIEMEGKIKMIASDELNNKINRLLSRKLTLEHKEILGIHVNNIERYISDLKWVYTANNFSWIALKRNITETEKRLSEKYFNKAYVEMFNKACNDLKGNFGISVETKAIGGRSQRQLLLKGKSPMVILSEGEQTVIALADFIAEMQFSDINRGLIFDDPVTSLDDERKALIAKYLSLGANERQIIIFTHDLVFVSLLINYCSSEKIDFQCHWIERNKDNSGFIWLNNTPSLEKDYRTSGKAQNYVKLASNRDIGPQDRERHISEGFAALRTSYEAIVVFDLFKGVVQRFNDRVSIDSLSSVRFNDSLKDEIIDSFHICCRFMTGHSHSIKYAYVKPDIQDLNNEIKRFDELKKKIKEASKPNTN